MSSQNFNLLMSPQNGYLSITSHPSQDKSTFLYCEESFIIWPSLILQSHFTSQEIPFIPHYPGMPVFSQFFQLILFLPNTGIFSCSPPSKHGHPIGHPGIQGPILGPQPPSVLQISAPNVIGREEPSYRFSLPWVSLVHAPMALVLCLYNTFYNM